MELETKAELPRSNGGRSMPADALVSGEIIRPGVAEIIRKSEPQCTSWSMIGSECLNLFRSEYARMREIGAGIREAGDALLIVD